jgi:multisubunit Na+/H+ antiporter MnhB subunit
MTRVVARVLLAPTLVAAVAILVKGYAQPGDGFSAGAVAALAILMQYLAFGRYEVERTLPVRGIGKLSYIGLLLALTVAIVPLLLGDPVFTHYPGGGGHVVYVGTIELITAVAFDCGIFLLVLGYGTGVISLVSQVMDDPSVANAEESGYEVGRTQGIEEGRTL